MVMREVHVTRPETPPEGRFYPPTQKTAGFARGAPSASFRTTVNSDVACRKNPLLLFTFFQKPINHYPGFNLFGLFFCGLRDRRSGCGTGTLTPTFSSVPQRWGLPFTKAFVCLTGDLFFTQELSESLAGWDDGAR